MPETLIKSRLHSYKHKPNIKQEPNKTQSNLPQIFKHLNKNYCQKMVLFIINELRRFSIIR